MTFSSLMLKKYLFPLCLCALFSSFCLIGIAHAQSTLTYDFETTGQFDANFRVIAPIGGGTASQTTVNGNGIFRQDVTSGTAAGIYLFDQTPADTSSGTQSTFATSGSITVSFLQRAVTTNSSFGVVFIDPANTANNLIAIFNLNTGSDTVRFFKDGTLVAGNVGTQVGSTVTQTTTAEPNSGNLTSLSVTLSVSGTTPTLSVTPAGATTTTYTLAAGDFNFNAAKTLIALRLNDAGSTSSNTPVDIDNVVITSPTAPDNAPGPPQDNVAPTLPAQADRSVAALDTLLVTNTATDVNTPAQTLNYQLTTAPVGASISSNGVISWTPTASQVSATPYTFTTLVTDSGTPALTATNTFQVTVTAAPIFEYSQSLDFTNSSDFANNFRTLSDIDGGTLGPSGGALSVDARSAGGSTAGVIIYDTTPNDTTNATQTAFPTNKQVRVSFLARASTTGSIFTVSFADPRNANNRVSASFIIRTGDDTVRFNRDGTLTSTSSTEGTLVGSDANFDADVEPASGNSVPVTVVLTVNGTTPTLTVVVGSGSPITSAFSAGDIDWSSSLVLLRFSDPSTSAGALEIDNLLVAGGTPVTPDAPTLPPAPGVDGNLITVNPSFETGSLSNFSGSYSFTGWTGTNSLFASHAINTGSVAAGTTTDGVKYLRQSWGGTLTTAVTSRPSATPGTTYELTYDQRSLIRNFPTEKLGCTPTIEFFDAVGVRIKSAWNFIGRYRIQDTGINTWETFTVRAIAPPGTSYIGLFFNNPSGRYSSATENYTQDRHVEMDNIRLKVVPETLDRLAYRRLPRLVEPGQVASLKIHHVTLAARTLRASLVNASGSVVATSRLSVPKGRFRATPINLNIPINLPNGIYSWKVELLPNSGGPAVATLNMQGVVLNETIAAPDLNGTDFRADNVRVQYMGRIEELANGSRWLHWHGSEIRVRFAGTSLTMVGAVSDNSFGTYDAWNFYVVIDENFAAPFAIAAPLNGSTFTRTLVTGLTDGVHTARIYKGSESNLRLRLDALRTDTGRGLLLPEPLSPRKIETFGDSVTSGSSASFGYNGYADVLSRELDARMNIVSKGGTGVAASFSDQALLGAYWDNLAFPNVFNGANTNPGSPWDFSRYTPDIVLIAIGHNDQFNGGAGTNFNNKYAEFKGFVRAAYPGIEILSLNTLISAPLGHFQNALDPLIATDPKHVFTYQPISWVDSNTGHPPTDGHAAQVYGDERRSSLADVVEDRAGWGLSTALTGYEQWAVTNFTSVELAAGAQAPAAITDGVSNLQRYASGVAAHGAFPVDKLLTPGTDIQGRLTLSFPRGGSDVDYVVEVSDNLQLWEVAAVNPGTQMTMVQFTDTIAPANAMRRFGRLILQPKF